MWLLVDFIGVGILFATAICFVVLSVIGHHLSRVFVFAGAGGAYRQSLLRFLIAMGATLALNLLAMKLATQFLGIPYLLASAAIAAIFFVGNFLVHCRWTFR